MGFIALILIAVAIYVVFAVFSSISKAQRHDQYMKEEKERLARREARKRDLARDLAKAEVIHDAAVAALPAVAKSLSRSGDIKFYDLNSLQITCGNGHHYLLQDFYGTDDRYGCPSCETSIYTFDNPALRSWQVCTIPHEEGVLLHKQGQDAFPTIGQYQDQRFSKGQMLFYKHELTACPMCAEIQKLAPLKHNMQALRNACMG